MNDDVTNINDLKEEERVLKTRVAEADAMKGLVDSEAGKLLIQKLHDTYELFVRAAVRESEKYSSACRGIEELAAFMGDTISLGQVARDQLERMRTGIGEEDY